MNMFNQDMKYQDMKYQEKMYKVRQGLLLVCNPTVFLASKTSRYRNMQSTKMMTETSQCPPLAILKKKNLKFFSCTVVGSQQQHQHTYNRLHINHHTHIYTAASPHTTQLRTILSYFSPRQCFQMLIVLRTG